MLNPSAAARAQAILWTRPHLAELCDAIRHALEAVAGEGGSDAPSLDKARAHGHQIAHTLDTLTVGGAAKLAHALAAALDHIDQDVSESDATTMLEAVAILPDYLERLETGAPDTPEVLAGQIARLRALTGAASESADTGASLSVLNPETPPDADSEDPNALRREWQRALRDWLMDSQEIGGLVSVTEGLVGSSIDSMRRVGVAASATFAAMAADKLAPAPELNKELAGIDGLLRIWAVDGPGKDLDTQADRTAGALLGHLQRAEPGLEAVDRLRSAPASIEPQDDPSAGSADPEEIERARSVLSGRNRELFTAVAEAARGELSEAKDSLNATLLGTADGAPDTEQQTALLQSVSESLGMLGLKRLAERVNAQAGRLGELTGDPESPVLLDVARELLLVDSELEEAVLYLGEAPESEILEGDGEHLPKSEHRRVMRQLLAEMLDDLNQAKHLLDQVHRGQGDDDSSVQARETLERLSGVLRIAGLGDAADLIDASARSVQEELIDQPVDQADRERLATLAESLVVTEFYLDSLTRLDDRGPEYLASARANLVQLGYIAEPADTVRVEPEEHEAEPAEQAGEEPASEATDEREADAGDTAAEAAPETGEPDPDGEGLDFVLPEEPAEAEQATDEESETSEQPTEHLEGGLDFEPTGFEPAAEAAEDDEEEAESLVGGGIDFVRDEDAPAAESERTEEDEADREAAEAEASDQAEEDTEGLDFAALADETDGTEAQDETPEPEPEEAREIEDDDALDIDFDALQADDEAEAEAESGAETDTESESEPEAEEKEERESEPEPEPESTSALAGDDFDLTEIFLEEFDEELAALRERLPRWRKNLNDRDVLGDIRRSFHTLKGSGRMAGAEEIGEFGWAFEQILNQTLDNQFRPEDVVDLVDEAVEALPSLRNRLVGDPAELDEAAIQQLVARAGRVGAEQQLPELEGLDDQLIQLMIKEIGDHLDTVDEWINGSRQQGWALPVNRDLIRSVHTIKGTLRLAPVGDEADSMQIIEEYLQELADTDGTPSDDAVALIEDMRTMLGKRLDRLNQQAVSTAHFETRSLGEHARSLISSLHRRRDADDAAFSAEYDELEAGEVQNDDTESSVDEPAEIDSGPASDESEIEEELVAEDAAEEAEFEDELETEDTAEEAELEDEPETEDAAEEAELEDEPETEDTAEEAELEDEPETEDTAEEAELEDEPETEDTAEEAELEDELETEDTAEEAELEDELETEDTAEEAELEDELETEDTAEDAELEDELESGIEVAGPVEATFEEWPESQIGQLDQPARKTAEEESAETTEARASRDTIAIDYASLDDELVDLFAEEGQELLEHSDGLLQQWRENPGDRALVTALQRDVHTIKGSARMAGLNPIGEVAHVLEDLLENIAGGRQEATSERIDTLETGCDHLHGMVDAVTRREALPARPAGADAETADETGSALESATAERADADIEASTTAEARTGRASTIRLASERVEELLNFAGEISIFRSRIEQEIGGFRGNIGEIEQTVARLREQLRNLEAETEAQILSRYEREHGPDEEEFDPLELDRYSTIQQLSRALAESVSDLNSLTELMDDSGRQAETLLMQQARVNTELQEGLMQARMVSFNTLAPRLRRVVRNAARDAGRRAELEIVAEGEGELDRNVLDRMTAPIEHILRNAIAHGIESPSDRRRAGKDETGTIRIEIDREATELLIRISDDGSGLNLDRIRERALELDLITEDAAEDPEALSQVIFKTGLTTAEAVSELAGRGVGMDVVASEVRQVGGRINVNTEQGQGTRFTLRIPLSLAVMQAIFVHAAERLFSIPLQSVRGVAKIRADEWQDALDGDGMFHYGGQEYPLLELEPQLGFEPEDVEEGASLSLLMITTGDQRAAIRVTEIEGHREIVLKPVGPQISSIPGILGGTIMGDGQVVVLLDMAPLIERAIREQRLPGMIQRTDSTSVEAEEVKRTPLVMVVDDSITMRRVTSRILEHHGLEVITARDGVEAVDLLYERVPDLMLLDIEMPRMDGFELAGYVRDEQRLSDIPIMMITSRSGDKHRDRAKKLGVQRYLIKPYQEANMVRNVFEMLDMPVPGDE